MNEQTSFYIGFFLGLLEGDGSIQVNSWKKIYLQFRIVIKLKENIQNYQMCLKLRECLGVMNVHIRHGYIIMVEDDKKKLLQLMQIIEKYGLITTNRRKQYIFFRYCFYSNIHYSEYHWIKKNFAKWLKLTPNSPFGILELKPNIIENKGHFPDWVSGFTEAEGCFCIRKNGSYSFSIAQKHEKNTILAIKNFFEIPNNLQAKSNELFAIETYNRYTLQKIIEFFEDPILKYKRLLGYKNVQLREFSLSFYNSFYHKKVS